MKRKDNYIKLIGLHVLIGILIFLFEPLSKLYFLVIASYFFIKIISSKRDVRVVQILMACAYVVGCDVFLRMTGGNFLYEISKYLIIIFIVIGLFYDGIKNSAFPYLIYLFLLIPGIFAAGMNVGYDTNFRTDIAFSLGGPVCLGIVSLYCYSKKINYKDLQKVLLAALLPIITMTIYLFLYTPDIREVVTGTYSNFQTSGGFGPNQVSTILGLGMFIVAVRYFLESKNIIMKGLNLFILAIISYRGIVTFSRGGVFVALTIIIVFLGIYFISSSLKNKRKTLRSLYLFFGMALLIWITSSIQTMGLINKRYANQDAAGRVKESMATGRSNLFNFEMDQFLENPFFGVGVGRVKEIRLKKEGINAASHNEISRNLAEHGFVGIFALLILIITPLFFRVKNKRNIFFYSFYLFWFLTINHSSMRIAAPAFIYGLSLLNIHHDKNPLHRKQIKPRELQ